MSKTLANVRDHVRCYLDEATQADWKDTEVDREINSKYMDLYSDVVTIYEDYYSSTALVNSVADQQEYTLPTDFYKMRRVEINYSPSNSSAIPNRACRVSMDDILRDMGNQGYSLTPHSRPGYYIRGNYYGFIPIPTESGTNAIKIWYIAIISDLSEDTDEFNLPFVDNYSSIIALGAAGELLRKGQQEEAVAKAYLADYEYRRGQMKNELKERTSDWSRTVTDVVGNRLDFSETFVF